jgi:phosphoglycerol transferase MdoB-like AlkP superfamily enzyme
VWARILVLFLALALVKIALLVGLHRHLCEIHWRVRPPLTTWCNDVAFYLFVGLGVLSLLGLARHCRSAGLGAVRAANGAVLLLGLLFVFLTFHSGDNNYLYPIQTGILKWTSLGPYLSLDLFFRPPFLAAWFLGYAFVYYVFVRGGRESWVLHLTALCAGAYGLLCLRELSAYRNELLLVDCLGVVSLGAVMWAGKRSALAQKCGVPVRLWSAWLLAPAAWSLCFAVALCCLGSGHGREPLCYFLMLLTTTLILFAGVTVLARKRGYSGSWSGAAFFYFAAFLLLTNNHYPMAANYNNALCLGLVFPHYFSGELLLVAALAVGAWAYCRLWPRAGFWWLDILILGFIAVAFIDLRLSRIMGARLDWDVILFAMGPKVMWRMAGPYLPGVVAALAMVVLVYALAVRMIQRWAGRRRASTGGNPPNPGAWYALASFALLALLGSLLANPDKAEGQAGLRLIQTSPLWKRVANRPVSREQFLRSAKALGLGDFAAGGRACPAGARRDLNVVLIFLESSFNQHLSLFGSSEETQPLLSRYKDRMELFPNFFSNFAGSIQAEFATFTGLYPVRDFNEFTLQRVNVKSLFEVFHENGYTCSLFFSSLFDYAGLREFLNQRGIDEMYDADTMPGQRKTERVAWGLREEETLGAIQSQIRKYAARDQRFFLTYVPAAPHYPYDGVPERFRRFKRGQLGNCTPLYLNELLCMDWVMASIMDQLQESGLLDRTLVIVTNDHGEKTGEDEGCIGHGWDLTPQLANTPLIVMDPQNPGCRLNYAIGSQIDVLPTVLDRLKIPLPPGQLYQGRSLYAPAEKDDRVIYLNTYEQYGIIARNRFICGSRKADEGGAAAGARSVYAISNQGSKTLFTEDRVATEQPWLIRPFDDFQANLLRNYSFYCQSVWGARQTASLGSGR